MVSAVWLYGQLSDGRISGVLDKISSEDKLNYTIRLCVVQPTGTEITYSVSVGDDYTENKYFAYILQYILGYDQCDLGFIGIDLWDNTNEEMRIAAMKLYMFLYMNQDVLGSNVILGCRYDDRTRAAITFGDFYSAHVASRVHYGFLYTVELTNGILTKSYVGQKSFCLGDDWRTYDTSSNHVHKLLEKGWSAEYKIISYHDDRDELDNVENELILREWRLNSLRNINYSVTLRGNRFLKYDYLKRFDPPKKHKKRSW